MSAQHPIAPDSYRLERAGRVLHAGTADGFPNLTKPELRALAATARALAASAEARGRDRREAGAFPCFVATVAGDAVAAPP